MRELVMFVVGIVTPVLAWGVILMVTKRRWVSKARMLQFLGGVRWISWIAAGCFLVLDFWRSMHWQNWSWALAMLSLGLMLPQSWLKKQRQANDLVFQPEPRATK